MAKRDTSPPRGMRDILPAQAELRARVERTIRESYRRRGFTAVETPALESLSFLTGGQGGENEKLIFKILKRGEKLDLAAARSIDDLVEHGLRYDLTVPLARYYAQNHGQLPTPFKALQIGPVWRAERPQKGRYRQFTQCDIDILGDDSVLAEVDLIAATLATLDELGLHGAQVRINHRRLLSLLVTTCGLAPSDEAEVLITLDKLDKLGWPGVAAELADRGHALDAIERLRVQLSDLTGATDREAVLLEGIDRLAQQHALGTGDSSGSEAVVRLRAIHAAFARTDWNGRLRYDPTLVRGMGYYTGPIFEVALEGQPFSVAGGGRYDRMVGELIGKPVSACGISIGFERVVLVLEERAAATPAAASGRSVALLADRPPGATGGGWSGERIESFRRDSAARWGAISLLPARKNLAAQLDELARSGFTHWARFDGERVGEPVELKAPAGR